MNMDKRTLEELKTLAQDCAREAGETCRKRLKEFKQEVPVSFKTSHADIVTQVDTEVERLVTGKILQRYPDHGILGEEGTFDKDYRKFDTLWIIDPIDGTINFVNQQMNFVISLAVYHKGDGLVGVIFDPVRDEMFTAVRGEGAYLNGERLSIDASVNMSEALICSGCFWNSRASNCNYDAVVKELSLKCRGIRVLGAAALELAYVACGRMDAYMTLFLNPWDCAAGILLVEEAGGRVSRIDGEELDVREKGSVLASRASIYPDLLKHTEALRSVAR